MKFINKLFIFALLSASAVSFCADEKGKEGEAGSGVTLPNLTGLPAGLFDKLQVVGKGASAGYDLTKGIGYGLLAPYRAAAWVKERTWDKAVSALFAQVDPETLAGMFAILIGVLGFSAYKIAPEEFNRAYVTIVGNIILALNGFKELSAEEIDEGRTWIGRVVKLLLSVDMIERAHEMGMSFYWARFNFNIPYLR